MTTDRIGRLFGLYKNSGPILSISYIAIRIFEFSCPELGNSGG
jgi:hypothetical protein